MNTNRYMRDRAARFLAAVYGPLGPYDGMRAWWQGIEEAERLTRASSTGPYSLGAALEAELLDDDRPGYLANVDRIDMWKDTANYVDRHQEPPAYYLDPKAAA